MALFTSQLYDFLLAERLYYQDLFNAKENSMKKLWNNINNICSFKKKNNKFNITKINVHKVDFWSLFNVQRI